MLLYIVSLHKEHNCFLLLILECLLYQDHGINALNPSVLLYVFHSGPVGSFGAPSHFCAGAIPTSIFIVATAGEAATS